MRSAPELPGFLRELGSTYDKLGAAPEKREFYRRYLVQRPLGSNADVVRAELARDKDILGTLQVSSSLPCTELWINRQRLTGKLPDKGIIVAPQLQGAVLPAQARDGAVRVRHGRSPAGPRPWRSHGASSRTASSAPPHRGSRTRGAGVMIDLGISSPEVGVRRRRWPQAQDVLKG